MAISSVLERTNNTPNAQKSQAVDERILTEDELHNSQISENYAKLINPDCSAKDILKKREVEETKVDIFDTVKIIERNRVEEPVQVEAPIQSNAAVEEKRQADEPYFVRNARADSYIFRANSPVNSMSAEAQFKRSVTAPAAPAVHNVSDDENEDLLPTPTTIQYKTVSEVNRVNDGKIQNKSQSERAKKLIISKKEKITIAAVITMIVALFVLIIVNSAIISRLSNDVASLEDSYAVTKSTHDSVLSEKSEYLSDDSMYKVVTDFAERNGMVKK